MTIRNAPAIVSPRTRSFVRLVPIGTAMMPNCVASTAALGLGHQLGPQKA